MSNRNKSELELKAERFFDHDSLLSASDEEVQPAKSRPSTRTKRGAKNTSKQSTKRLTSRKQSVKGRDNEEPQLSAQRNSARSKSRNPRDKSLSNLKGPRAMPDNVSSLKDNYTLRMKLSDLSKTVGKKNQQIKRLYENIYNEKEEIRELTIRANDASKKSRLVEEFQQKILDLQENEMNLIRELNEQQKISKDALTRLYELQDESVKEIESVKKYYKDFYGQQAADIKEETEHRIDDITNEKDNLIATVKNIESVKELERSKQVTALSNEIILLKEQLQLSNMDNESLRSQNLGLKQSLKEQEDIATLEKNDLKQKIQELLELNMKQKSTEEEYITRDTSEKTKLYRKVESLEREVNEKQHIISVKDQDYKHQLEAINEKVQGLQKELRRMSEYEVKIEALERDVTTKQSELELAKQYYKEKIAEKKKTQQDQKGEWSSIYNELLDEIKGLKSEIGMLGVENKRLITSFNTTTVR